MSEVKESKGILVRYTVVLDIFAANPNGLTLTEVMNETGLPRGTVHRLITALLDVGYIERLDGRKVYVLGRRLLRMFHMGMPRGARDELEQIVQPVLEKLVEKFGETAFLAQLMGSKVVSAVTVLPLAENQSFVQPGRSMPIHGSASAKAIFAHQDGDLIDQALDEPLVKFTQATKTDKSQIKAELASIVSDGFAICDEELDPGIFSYACPVLMETEGVIYSVGLVGPSQRLGAFARGVIIGELQDSARQIAELLSSAAIPKNKR